MRYQINNKWSSIVRVKRVKAEKIPVLLPKAPKIFIPEIAVFGRFEVPSTPFNLRRNEPIFIGDIIEVIFKDSRGKAENTEYYLVDLVKGQYMGVFSVSESGNVLLADLLKSSKKNLKVIGNSFSDPALRLKLLNQ